LSSPLLFNEEFEVVIMIDVVTEEMHGSDRDFRPGIDYERALVGMATDFYESEMALLSEWME